MRGRKYRTLDFEKLNQMKGYLTQRYVSILISPKLEDDYYTVSWGPTNMPQLC